VNAQGEDVVAGIRTPNDIATMAKELPAAFEAGLQSSIYLEPLNTSVSF
jgi:pyruvate,orthophosphate dikinase